jgi:hypothetical protein
MELLTPFAPIFTRPTWRKAQRLLIGAILAPRQRTVASALRMVGLSEDPNFAMYHHVLSRAKWSARRTGYELLHLLISRFGTGDGPLIFGIDETIERRKGPQIAAKGVYRDPVRSSASHFVKAMGLRWISLMWLVEIPWAVRVWALPVMTALAPSARYYTQRGRTPRTLTERAIMMLRLLRRWLPERELVVVGDQTYAARALLQACRTLPRPITVIARLRLDAALWEPPPPRAPGRPGRPALKGDRLPALTDRLVDPMTRWTQIRLSWYQQGERLIEFTSGTAIWYSSGSPAVPIRWVLIRDPAGLFDAQALLCTDLTLDPVQILQWFQRRWSVEVTFEEARAHLGVETQRQWSDRAIARTTPTLLGLFSWITLAADHLHAADPILPRTTAWYAKPRPTFSDAIAAVRRCLWPMIDSLMSPPGTDFVKLTLPAYKRLVDVACYAT